MLCGLGLWFKGTGSDHPSQDGKLDAGKLAASYPNGDIPSCNAELEALDATGLYWKS